jgi:hypothetical protein
LRRLEWSGYNIVLKENGLVTEECRSCLFLCLLPFNNSLRLLFFSIGSAWLGETFEASRTDDIGCT